MSTEPGTFDDEDITLVELLREERDSQHARRLEDALGRMERLIDELLTLARQGNTIGETDRTLYADRNRLTAALENLFRNAVEHGSDGAAGDTSVTVTVGDLVDRNGFYVADDGGGIPEPEREQVLESGYSTAEDGTGFGLILSAVTS